MVLLDVNVLVAASRAGDRAHESCLTLLQLLSTKRIRCLIPVSVASAYLRIISNKRIFPDAISIDRALHFLNALLADSTFELANASDSHWSFFTSALLEINASGDLVPDAQLAALAIEADATLISQDADFARFSQLRWWRVDEALTQLQAAI